MLTVTFKIILKGYKKFLNHSIWHLPWKAGHPLVHLLFYLVYRGSLSQEGAFRDVLEIGGQHQDVTLSMLYSFLTYLSEIRKVLDAKPKGVLDFQVRRLLSRLRSNNPIVFEYIVRFVQEVFVGIALPPRLSSCPEDQMKSINKQTSDSWVSGVLGDINWEEEEREGLVRCMITPPQISNLSALFQSPVAREDVYQRFGGILMSLFERRDIPRPLLAEQYVIDVICFLVGRLLSDGTLEGLMVLDDILKRPHQVLQILIGLQKRTTVYGLMMRTCSEKIQEDKEVREAWCAYVKKLFLAEELHDDTCVDLVFQMFNDIKKGSVYDRLFGDLGEKKELFIHFSLSNSPSASDPLVYLTLDYVLNPNRNPEFFKGLNMLSYYFNQPPVGRKLNRTQRRINDYRLSMLKFNRQDLVDSFVVKAQKILVLIKYFLSGEMRAQCRKNLSDELQRQMFVQGQKDLWHRDCLLSARMMSPRSGGGAYGGHDSYSFQLLQGIETALKEMDIATFLP